MAKEPKMAERGDIWISIFILARTFAQRIAGHTSPAITRIYDFALDADYPDGSKTDRLYFTWSPPNILVKTFSGPFNQDPIPKY
jgi:hypothetical protein